MSGSSDSGHTWVTGCRSDRFGHEEMLTRNRKYVAKTHCTPSTVCQSHFGFQFMRRDKYCVRWYEKWRARSDAAAATECWSQSGCHVMNISSIKINRPYFSSFRKNQKAKRTALKWNDEFSLSFHNITISLTPLQWLFCEFNRCYTTRWTRSSGFFLLGASRSSSCTFFFFKWKQHVVGSAEVATSHPFSSGGCTSHASRCAPECMWAHLAAISCLDSGSRWQLGAAGWLENSCSRADQKLVRPRG